jgi:hypothetical protein
LSACLLACLNRDHSLLVIHASFAYRGASALALRRAALFSLRLAFECYLLSATAGSSSAASTSSSVGARAAVSPLEALMDISDGASTSTYQSNKSSNGSSRDRDRDGSAASLPEAGSAAEAQAMAAMTTVMTQPVLVQCVDWAAGTWRDDADEVSRSLKREIVAMAINGIQ